MSRLDRRGTLPTTRTLLMVASSAILATAGFFPKVYANPMRAHHAHLPSHDAKFFGDLDELAKAKRITFDEARLALYRIARRSSALSSAAQASFGGGSSREQDLEAAVNRVLLRNDPLVAMNRLGLIRSNDAFDHALRWRDEYQSVEQLNLMLSVNALYVSIGESFDVTGSVLAGTSLNMSDLTRRVHDLGFQSLRPLFERKFGASAVFPVAWVAAEKVFIALVAAAIIYWAVDYYAKSNLLITTASPAPEKAPEQGIILNGGEYRRLVLLGIGASCGRSTPESEPWQFAAANACTMPESDYERIRNLR